MESTTHLKEKKDTLQGNYPHGVEGSTNTLCIVGSTSTEAPSCVYARNVRIDKKASPNSKALGEKIAAAAKENRSVYWENKPRGGPPVGARRVKRHLSFEEVHEEVQQVIAEENRTQEQERLQREQEEQERLRQEEAARLEQERRAEEERQRQAEEQRLQQEAQARRAQEEAAQRQREEQARLAREAEEAAQRERDRIEQIRRAAVQQASTELESILSQAREIINNAHHIINTAQQSNHQLNLADATDLINQATTPFNLSVDPNGTEENAQQVLQAAQTIMSSLTDLPTRVEQKVQMIQEAYQAELARRSEEKRHQQEEEERLQREREEQRLQQEAQARRAQEEAAQRQREEQARLAREAEEAAQRERDRMEQIRQAAVQQARTELESILSQAREIINNARQIINTTQQKNHQLNLADATDLINQATTPFNLSIKPKVTENEAEAVVQAARSLTHLLQALPEQVSRKVQLTQGAYETEQTRLQEERRQQAEEERLQREEEERAQREREAQEEARRLEEERLTEEREQERQRQLHEEQTRIKALEAELEASRARARELEQLESENNELGGNATAAPAAQRLSRESIPQEDTEPPAQLPPLSPTTLSPRKENNIHNQNFFRFFSSSWFRYGAALTGIPLGLFMLRKIFKNIGSKAAE